MDDFPKPNQYEDEGAVGGHEDIEMYDFGNNNDGYIDDDYETQFIGNHDDVQLSQADRFKIEDIKILFERYEKDGMKSINKFTDPNDFILKKIDSGKAELRLKKYPDVRLLKDDGTPYAISTLGQRIGMDGLKILGFEDYRKTPKIKLTKQSSKRLENNLEKLDNTEPFFQEDPLSVIKYAKQTVEDAINIVGRDEVLKSMGITYTYRELLGLDKALTTQKGELTLNLDKLSKLDEHIDREETKLTQTNDPEMIARIKNRLSDLRIERDSRLEAVSTNKQLIKSQIYRIKETVHQILNDDNTLGEKLRILFREQGLTLVSILSAVTLAISTIILALTRTITGGGSTPFKPGDPKKTGFIKRTLDRIAQGLKWLAGKAASALPGIIGSLISFIFNLLSKTVGFVAENTWAMLIAAGSIILYIGKNYIK